jgi:hypothetical protein
MNDIQIPAFVCQQYVRATSCTKLTLLSLNSWSQHSSTTFVVQRVEMLIEVFSLRIIIFRRPGLINVLLTLVNHS